MADLAMRPLSLGEQLDRTFTIYRERFGALLISTVICMLVPVLMMANSLKRITDFTAATQGGATPEETMQLAFGIMGKLGGIMLVALIGFVVARASLAWISHKAMLGDRADAFEGLEKGIRFFLPMLGLSIVEGAIYMVAAGILYVPALLFLVGSMRGGGGAGAALTVFFVFLLIIAVMVWMVTGFFVTSAVLICEPDATVFKSIERSWSLTKGRRWPILGGMAVVVVLTFILQLGLGIAFGVAGGAAGGQEGPMMLAAFGLNALVNLLTTGYYYVFQMVTYYDLRIRKEGLDLELASEAMAPA